MHGSRDSVRSGAPRRVHRRQRSSHSLPWLALGVLLAWSCREVPRDGPAKLGPCRAFGQQCEYSPGKLGSCVELDNCQSGECFVCQSQH